MGVTEQLARFAIETPGDFLSPAMIASAKVKFFDTIGIMVAGAHHPAGQMAHAVARHNGGTPVATLIGHSERTSAAEAGFVNGVAAHALEYDDYTRTVGHGSVVLVPGCIAVAEELGVSGRTMLEAFALGFEVTTRVAKGLRPALLERGWHPIGIVGGQGVAMAASRMMGLDSLRARMAMGIMASSSSGVRKNVGSMGKAFHVGQGVRSGIFAAQLAREGFRVDPDIIEGSDEGGEGHQRFGLADSFNGIGNYRLHLMTEGLGTAPLEMGRNTTMLRMHPGSTAPGAAIDALIEMVTTHGLKSGDVEEILLECTPQCLAIAPYPEPSDEHRAKFCLPYTMSVAFLDRKVGLAQYAEARIADPVVRAKLRPTHPYGCKRPLMSNVYYRAVNEPNLELITDPIVRITPTGVVTDDGVERTVDTIILATGFTATRYLSAIDVVGRDGRHIDEAWDDGAQAYLGITTAGFPNLFTLVGPGSPATPAGTGSRGQLRPRPRRGLPDGGPGSAAGRRR
jgi:2-methylcitrate dehydratase PrpD